MAKALGTTRALMKGTAEKADIIHELFHVDVKLRKRWEILRWFRELKEQADKRGKIPVLTVREPEQKLRLAVIDFDTFVSLTKAAGWSVETKSEDIDLIYTRGEI